MKKQVVMLLVVLSVLGHTHSVLATVVVDRMFTDNMVLQRDMQVPIWGTADPGEKVAVAFAGQKQETTAGKDGKWLLRLDPLKTSAEGRALTVSGTQLTNVLVGEVWLGSGQSNMAGGTGGYMRHDPVLANMATNGPYATMRLYRNGWAVADEATIKGFSAIHFSFGYALHQELNVPVGLMVGAVGGTPSGRWLTQEMAAADPALMKMLKEENGYDSIADMYSKRDEAKKKHAIVVAKAKAEGNKAPRFRRGITIGDLYAKHIAHYVPYGIRGVLWDQGESRTQIPGVDQITTMNALINGWRHTWNQPPAGEGSDAPCKDFPFLHVQKPSGGGCAWDPQNPVNLLAVTFGPLPAQHVSTPGSLKYELDHIKIATLKNAPIVTASDLAPGIHPRTKSAYGTRACRVALGAVYGRDIAICGPVYKAHKVEGSSIRVAFDHIGQGLAFKHGDLLQGFEIAGSDGAWEWATATIDGDTVVVSHDKVAKPVKVQYAFSKKHNYANLFNQDGLPALMFTTAE
ncbi:MAG: hypothetical protein HN919_17065 [Verrucomicrobia bacterium]|jgi:sialate O-acetylesterase|nr:hypothetical protein [Verrucomicrobiota bacterium]MBT7068012.1 hypothetical protein [Verrucomicrobiota bacterium]MBT7698967.1 hypothetical protein [Verrucomicrobiota bacterium]